MGQSVTEEVRHGAPEKGRLFTRCRYSLCHFMVDSRLFVGLSRENS